VLVRWGVRFLGVDVGRKRIGLAVSDASGLVARPWKTLQAGPSLKDTVARLTRTLGDLRDPLDESPGVHAIVVGLPRRLDGSDNEQTALARTVAVALAEASGLDVHLQDERLTSHEAEQRLAEREPDWRRRKTLVDAEAAAIILQDFLDARRQTSPVPAAGQAGV